MKRGGTERFPNLVTRYLTALTFRFWQYLESFGTQVFIGFTWSRNKKRSSALVSDCCWLVDVLLFGTDTNPIVLVPAILTKTRPPLPLVTFEVCIKNRPVEYVISW